MTNYYDLLGVSSQASELEIKKAYRKMAMKHHPDKKQHSSEEEKSNSIETFKEISHAYSVLSDSQQRRIYDQFGEDGLKKGGSTDPFSAAFGGGFPFNFPFPGMSRRTRTPITNEHIIHVDLDTFYHGKNIAFRIQVKHRCLKCDATGCNDETKLQTCQQCHGRGQVVQQKRIGPGFLTQQVVPCHKCKTKGKIFDTKYTCQECKGATQVKVNTQVDFYIEKGTDYGDYFIENKGDATNNGQKGTVLLKIRPPKTSLFQYIRKPQSGDLYLQINLSLYEALTGFERSVLHVSKERLVNIANSSNEIIAPNTIRKLANQGLPEYNPDNKSETTYGNLYLIFKVDFPKKLSKHSQQLLKNILPNKESIQQRQLRKLKLNKEEFDLSSLDQPSENLTRRHLEVYQECEDAMEELDEETSNTKTRQMPSGIPPDGIQCAQQ